jgi:hypothetical protein
MVPMSSMLEIGKLIGTAAAIIRKSSDRKMLVDQVQHD